MGKGGALVLLEDAWWEMEITLETAEGRALRRGAGGGTWHQVTLEELAPVHDV